MSAVVNHIERTITEYINSEIGPSRVKPSLSMGKLLNHLPLQGLSIDIRFPGSGTEYRNAKRISGSVVSLISFIGVDTVREL